MQGANARMCFKNNYSRYCSVTRMLKDLDLPTLQHRKNRAKLSMLYKIINHMIAVPDNCLTPIPSFLKHGHFKQLNTRIDCFKFSFLPLTNKLWNQIPHYLTNSTTYTQFCNTLDNKLRMCIIIYLIPAQ